ncbi:MAG: alpha/beta hydrolase [Candidatus Eremiobacteraeota bacterium]|nr:alpha/beta hydrolase [Candidatus Eremiobacteraeota bacterium]
MIGTIALDAADGASTGARWAGSRGRALVFVHGVGSTAAIWDRQLLAFGDRYRCYAIELRGNGVPKPEPSPSLITRAGYAADVLAVCEHAGIERFTLVGCSLGGVVAFELWTIARERIESMVIVGSFAAYPDGIAYARTIGDAVETAGSMPEFARRRAGKLSLPEARVRETVEQMAIKTSESYLAATEATWTGDYSHVLASIDVPVLVTCGEHDSIAPPALSEALAAGIPHSQFSLVPAAGHVANADNPAAFNDLLGAFLH